MTEKKNVPPRGFFFSGERSGGGMRITFGAVVSVSELAGERILLVSHGGKVEISGEGLELTVFEGRAVEVVGAVREVKFIYGKN